MGGPGPAPQPSPPHPAASPGLQHHPRRVRAAISLFLLLLRVPPCGFTARRCRLWGFPEGTCSGCPPSAAPPAVTNSEGQPGCCSPLACCHPTDPNRHTRSPSPPFTSLFNPAAPGPCPVGQRAPGVAPHGKGRAGVGGSRCPGAGPGRRPTVQTDPTPAPGGLR